MHSDFQGSEPTRTDVKAIVKWFNPTKGFGFVQMTDGSPDAFLHVSVLERLGRADLPEGTEILCDIVEGRKGPQVAAIVRIAALGEPSSRAPMVQEQAGDEIEGTVKFFNADKGFGFVTPDDGSRDVFISARLLERLGLSTLEPSQRVRVTTRMGQKGPMAASLDLA